MEEFGEGGLVGKVEAVRYLGHAEVGGAQQEGGFLWNFTKFLISRDGTQVKRYTPTTDPEKMVADIEQMLGY